MILACEDDRQRELGATATSTAAVAPVGEVGPAADPTNAAPDPNATPAVLSGVFTDPRPTEPDETTTLSDPVSPFPPYVSPETLPSTLFYDFESGDIYDAGPGAYATFRSTAATRSGHG